MKLEDADFKELYTKWKKLILVYLDFYRTINNIKYIDDDELFEYIGELEELFYAIADKITVMGGKNDEY